MYPNGHTPDVTTMPKSRAEQAAEKTRERFISRELESLRKPLGVEISYVTWNKAKKEMR